MLVKNCIKFYENILNRYGADKTKFLNLLFSISKSHNSINKQSRVIVFAFCTSSIDGLYLYDVS